MTSGIFLGDPGSPIDETIERWMVTIDQERDEKKEASITHISAAKLSNRPFWYDSESFSGVASGNDRVRYFLFLSRHFFFPLQRNEGENLERLAV